ncbi:MAG: hypothetical protein EOO03_17030 [Chitinophagaceae bacterium]|nr:MAG: hypothetical protein EOO03_17030 [Chitinophagaceae bacterium]
MKKTTLFALLLLLSTFSFAQNKDLIRVSQVTFTETKATLTSFDILSKDKEDYISNLTQKIGTPVSNTSGSLFWDNITVEGLGNVPRVRLYDGLMTHNTAEKSSCFVPFKDAKDKQLKLAAIKPNQERQMKVEFVDKEGNCIIRNDEQAQVSRKFLSAALLKG